MTTKGRTSLFRNLQGLFRLAARSKTGEAVEEILSKGAELERKKFSRRDFLKLSLSVGGAVASQRFLPPLFANQSKSGGNGAKVAVVGAGVAGLHCAYLLSKNPNMRVEVYEASKRTGGRIYSVKDIVGKGLVTELGGEFIDSDHLDMLNLAKEFGLELYDRVSPEEDALVNTYYFGGTHYTDRQLLDAIRPALARIQKDFDGLGEIIDYRHPGNAAVLDRTPLSDYLKSIGLSGWAYDLIDSAYSTEFGLELSDQSALNLILMLPTGDHREKLELFGKSDERFKVKGGNQRIPDELAKRLGEKIRLEHRLESVKQKGNSIELNFIAPNGAAKQVTCDFAVLAIPYPILRDVKIEADLIPAQRKAIAELGYGTNSKLILGFTRRAWRDEARNGEIYSDLPFQMGWDSSRFQPTQEGSVTFLLGGKRGIEAGQGSELEWAARMSPELNKAFPGTLALRNGRQARTFWPGNPFSKGSYSSYRPGQWTSIAGAEGVNAGNLYFAGSDCSINFQGFMNGAAESGRLTAEAIMVKATSNKP